MLKNNKFTLLAILIFASNSYNIVFSKILKRPTIQAKKSINYDPIKLNKDLRKLWSDHVIWTKLYLISALNNDPNKKVITDRLLQNQVDLGNAIIPFYGKDAGKKLADLLKSHILIAAKIVDAAKVNNHNELKKQDIIWHQNAQDIANFLSNANKSWSKSDLLKMLNKHLELITNELTSHLKKDWIGEIKSFDKNYEHMLLMADALSDGIIKQNPSMKK